MFGAMEILRNACSQRRQRELQAALDALDGEGASEVPASKLLERCLGPLQCSTDGEHPHSRLGHMFRLIHTEYCGMSLREATLAFQTLWRRTDPADAGQKIGLHRQPAFAHWQR